MKRIICLLCLLLLLPIPSNAVVFENASFVSAGVEVFVDIEASTPWSAPFSQHVNLTLSVVPQMQSVSEVNITSISLIVNREEADGSGYSLIAADTDSGTPLATGNEYANYSKQLTLSSSTGGLNCYFAILVSGIYSNVTNQEYFQALSPENLVGPFAISISIISPQSWVGLIVIAISTVVFAAGIYGVKKSRTRAKRHSLLDE